MNPQDLESTIKLFSVYATVLTKNLDWKDVVICPPNIYITTLLQTSTDFNLKCSFGSQDIVDNPGWVKNGSFTGEISAQMYKSVGCNYAIVGHSERRDYFNLNDHDVQHKVESCTLDQITPIICVGYLSKEQVSKGVDVDFELLRLQIKIALFPYKNVLQLKQKFEYPIIAYEPVWAIGTGKIPTLEQIQEVNLFIRSQITTLIDADFAQKTSILYGGSVNENNITELKNCDFIDGFLIGGAGLKAESVQKLLVA